MAKGRPAGGRKSEILELFVRHVAERGYDGTNIGDLATELGMSKGTIVHHFGSKDRMLAESHEAYMRRRLAEAEIIVESLESPASQLTGLIHAFFLYQHEDRWATIAFQRETVRFRDNDVMAEAQRLRLVYLDLLVGILRTGMTAGSFVPGNPQLIALAIIGSAQWAWTWYDPDGTGTPEEVATEFTKLYLGGLLQDRRKLAPLLDPSGRIPRLVRSAIGWTEDPPRPKASVSGVVGDARE